MNSRLGDPKMLLLRSSTVVFCGVVLIQLFAAQIDAQRSTSPWQTLGGEAPRVIARGGFSGLFPDSSLDAYSYAISTSVAGAVLWCDVQLTKDGVGICYPALTMSNSSTIVLLYPNRTNTYPVNGVSTQGWFTIDFSFRDLKNVSLIRGILSRSDKFDENGYAISTVQNVANQINPKASISNPFRIYAMFRNPNERNSGKLMSLSEFLNLAKNSTSLSGVLISVENAAYLREKQGLDVVKAVLDTLTETGYRNSKTTKVMIQSTNSSVLVDFKKQSQYETVYKFDETIRDIFEYGIEEIKKFANAVVIRKSSVFPWADGFVTGQTNVVERLQKSQLPVYVELFRNEFVSQPYDFFDDATVEINTYITGVGINGTITEFPFTAARYKLKWESMFGQETNSTIHGPYPTWWPLKINESSVLTSSPSSKAGYHRC